MAKRSARLWLDSNKEVSYWILRPWPILGEGFLDQITIINLGGELANFINVAREIVLGNCTVKKVLFRY